MRVLTPKLIRFDAFALIHLDMLTCVTIVTVKNHYVLLTIINTKIIEETILRPLGNRMKKFESFDP